jgi:hypothetical protein
VSDELAPLHPDLDVGVARAAAADEEVSGDIAVAVRCRDGALLAAIDGVGHGAAAGEGAERAAALLAAHPDEPLEALVARCHEALAGTRGAALVLARVDARAATLTWLGVGNVAGRLVPADAARQTAGVIQLAGVVGQQLPPLVPVELALAPGDALMLATDGVDPEAADELRVRGAMGPLATGLLQRHRSRAEDDALVLVARFEPHERRDARAIVS